jgi:hypothetical protein
MFGRLPMFQDGLPDHQPRTSPRDVQEDRSDHHEEAPEMLS